MLPSVKTLRTVFGDNARQARRVLEMSRAELEATDIGVRRVAECYHPPQTSDIRLHVLNSLAGTCGVEALKTSQGWCDYLNVGDPYVPTLVRFRGRYRVMCYGDIVERFSSDKD